jgi:hypothetical protein
MSIDRASSDAMINRINAHILDHGFGFWAAGYRPERRLIGMIVFGADQAAKAWSLETRRQPARRPQLRGLAA